ncbi:hypothetical protein OJ252_1290 [Cryptosporidium canis]|uniref:Srp40 C-terminal domain-containing protein n=1 Tax=Cryptosporidium canis TaxID=195482 RepID=A0ABQ8PAM0_9CRYT|nr:hypothetical protein OJ252_1290 [Cryptosporidium canis]
MTEDIHRIQVLWLVREYFSGLDAKKITKYIEKYFPEINNLDKKTIKRLQKLPSLHDIVGNISNNKVEKTEEKNTPIENPPKSSKKKSNKDPLPKDISDTTNKSVVQVNANKKDKKRKATNVADDNSTSEETDLNTDSLHSDEVKSSTTTDFNESVCASVQNRFKRIDENKYKDKLSDERLSDNSYWNMKKYSNNVDDFASKAAFELGQVRGKGFRQEKAKKKRCSWKGNGTISTGVSSIQFSDSD